MSAMPTRIPSQSDSKYRDSALLTELGEMACNRFDDFLGWLGVDLKCSGKKYIGHCPIHGSRNNSESFNIYPDDEAYGMRGNWDCWTNPDCWKTFNKYSPVGFARGVMSHVEHGWSRGGDQTVPHRHAVDAICKFLGVGLDDIKVDRSKAERRKLIRTQEILSPTGRPVRELCTRQLFEKTHEIPSSYYLGRGYEESTLRTFMAGECISRKSPTFGRTNIPIFDEDGKIIIGMLSRSSYEECGKCGWHHSDATPCFKGGLPPKSYLRWDVNPSGFNDKLHLYGLWKSRKLIVASKCLVIVEGAGDVWRLWESGIQNAVAIMGSRLHTLQQIAIERCSPSNIVILTDDDEAGNQAAEAIQQYARRMCKVHRMVPQGKDLGGMSSEDVEGCFKGPIRSLMKRVDA